MANKSPTTAMGFMLGLGIGATAGILLAPRRGEETREQIRQKAIQAGSRVKEQLSRKKQALSDTVDEVAAAQDSIIPS